MPSIVVHNAMGDRVLKKLPIEVRDIINPEIFHFSVSGPNPYMFYRFFVPERYKRKIPKRAKRMHKTRTGQFLMELASYSKDDDMFSYLSGFLCHYALDSTTHPYINGKANKVPGMHMSIEHRLDAIELQRQGKKTRDLMKLFKKFPDLPDVWSAKSATYGWKNDYYKRSYAYMRMFFWLSLDPFGVLNILFKNKEGKLGTFSRKNKRSDYLDLSEFDSLEKEAEDMAVRLITAAYQYRNDEIIEEELRRVIGNRSYSGGVARD